MILDSIEKFDLDRKKSFLILSAIIIVWASYSTFNELTFPYEDCKSFGNYAEFGSGICTDYGMRLNFMNHYDDRSRQETSMRFVTYELLNLSNNVFGDYRIIPFISSGFLLLLTYFLTTELTKRNYTGLIAVLFVLHSPIFFKYDLVITYPSFWVTWLLFSFYSMFKVWQLSPISFLFSLSSKVLNLMNFPALLIFAYLTGNESWKKIVAVYSIMFAIVIGGVSVASMYYPRVWIQLDNIFISQFKFQPVEFLWWLGMWSIELFTDKLTLLMIFILLPCLFMLRKSEVKNSSAILAMIIIFILQPAFLSGFTTYTNEDYRYLHLVVFVGIGVAFLIPNVKTLVMAFQSYFTIKKR